MDKAIIKEIIEHTHYRLDESTRMINKCFLQLEKEDIWHKPNESSNSIGNLILHLCGNIRQYVISALGDEQDVRERNKEFESDYTYTKEELLQQLEHTIMEAKDKISRVDIDNLLQKRYVQGFHFSGIGIIIHVVEHYSYHTGQIALLTKLYKNRDLGFYDGMDLTVSNG